MLKNYRFGFDLWGIILFLITMIPTFVWLAVPPIHRMSYVIRNT